MRKNPRLLQKTLAIFLSFVLAMSCMGTALAAEADGNTGNTPTLTAAEKEEQTLTAQALAATSQYLRLSVTRMNLKAGETYTVNVVPAALAKMFGWTIGEVTTSNGKILEVVETNQETMTVTFKALVSGRAVSLKVQLVNQRLAEMVEQNPDLAKYEKSASKTMMTYVTTNNTATKVLAGVGVKETSSSSGGGSHSSGGSSSSGGNTGPTTTPSTPGGGVTDPADPDKPGTTDSDKPGGNEPGGTTPGGDPSKPGTTPGGDEGDDNPPAEEPVTAEATVDVTASSNNGVTSAAVKGDVLANAITEALEGLGDGDEAAKVNVTIDLGVAQNDGDALKLTLDADAVKALEAAGLVTDEDTGETTGDSIGATVTVKLGDQEVVLPLEAIQEAAKQVAVDGNGDVALVVKPVDAEAVKEALPTDDGKDGAIVDESGNAVDLEKAVFVDVTLEIDGSEATIDGLTEKIQITVAAPEAADGSGSAGHVNVYFVKETNDNGEAKTELSLVAENVEVGADGKATFETSHLTQFVVVESEGKGEVTDPVTPPEGGGDGEGEDPDKPGTTDPVTPPEGGGDGGDLPGFGEGSEEL